MWGDLLFLILSTLLVYFLLFFKSHPGTIFKIEPLFKLFVGDDIDDAHKIQCVKLDMIRLS